MKILITNPFCRPWVRRGAETILDELAVGFDRLGHEVTVLTSKPGKREECIEGNVRMVRFGQPGRWPFRHDLMLEIAYAIRCFFFLLTHRFDVAHCLFYADACALRVAGWVTGTPYVYHMLGLPVRRAYMRRPLDFLMLSAAMHGAHKVVLLSRFAADLLEKDYRLQSTIIPPPCDLNRFCPGALPDLAHPVFLAVGAFAEPRKGLRVLLRAYEIVKRTEPDAILRFSGKMPSQIEVYLDAVPAAVRSSIEILGTGSLSDLPVLYRSAAVTVLPSMWEAFGMVLTESLACGTPVVATRHGGSPEAVAEGVGALFDPGGTGSEAVNHEGLAAAMLKALALHDSDPDLRARCRAAAEPCSTETYLKRLDGMNRECVAPPGAFQPRASREL